jgi:hypothetical protein
MKPKKIRGDISVSITEVFKTRVAPKCSSAVTGAGYSTGTVWTVTAAGNFTISIAS